MKAFDIDAVASDLICTGVVPARAVLDGSLSVIDMSRRNRNYRASWSDGDRGNTGVILKYPDPVSPRSAATLLDEASFYAACTRIRSDPALAIATSLPGLVEEPALALRLVRNAVTLGEHRSKRTDLVGVHAALGKALAVFHRFGASDEARADPYFQGLSRNAPWVLSAHRPSLIELQHLGNARIGFLKILQGETELCEFLERIAADWEASTIIHADLKADNVLVGTSAGEPSVTLIDWELAQLGSPAWDIGAIFQDLFASWLTSLTPSAEKDMSALLGEGGRPIRALQPSFRAFWGAYIGFASLSPARREELLAASVRCSVAMFVQRACELAWDATAVPNHTVTMLQIAANIARAPAKASLFLFGLPLSTRRREGS